MVLNEKFACSMSLNAIKFVFRISEQIMLKPTCPSIQTSLRLKILKIEIKVSI